MCESVLRPIILLLAALALLANRIPKDVFILHKCDNNTTYFSPSKNEEWIVERQSSGSK